jgi:hypothetical protein
MLAPNELARCRTILQHTHIDWVALGYDDATIDELVEFLLRMIQSMVVALLNGPGRVIHPPPRPVPEPFESRGSERAVRRVSGGR